MVINDQWSMDQFFIENINSLIRRYVEADFEEDFEMMFKALRNLEVLTSPKLENDKVEENIVWLEESITKIPLHDNYGNKIGINIENKNLVRKKLAETFRLLLIKLEAANIYTKKVHDIRTAMGRLE
jgi:hypothetical protein